MKKGMLRSPIYGSLIMPAQSRNFVKHIICLKLPQGQYYISAKRRVGNRPEYHSRSSVL